MAMQLVAKRVLFALTPAAVLFMVLEVALAVAGLEPRDTTSDPYVGFAASHPLYQPYVLKGEEWLEISPGKERFFNAARFTRNKHEATKRIFCVGGSTTYGRPFHDTTSFCGWLRAALEELTPNKFEVINAGGISYASYRVASVVRELAGYSPDLVVIYTGHNEFLEDRTYSELRDRSAIVREIDLLFGRTRLYTLAQGIIGRGPEQLPAEVTARLDASIGPDAYTRDDEWAAAVVAHFRLNLDRIIDLTRGAGAVPLVVVPADNLADCSPFKSEHDDSVSERDRTTFGDTLAAGLGALREGESIAAVAHLQQAVELSPRHAHARYWLGRALVESGAIAEGERALVRARDEDICPLRAPSSIVEITREVIAAQRIPSVDFPALLANQTGNDQPRGADWFLDHVHPTVEGHRVLSRALLSQIEQLGWLPVGASSNEAALARADANVLAAIDDTERGLSLRNLAKVLSWAGKNEEAARAARQALDLLGDDAECLFILALDASDRGDHRDAVALLRETTRLDPEWIKPLHNLGVELARSGRDDDAIAVYDTVIEKEPKHPSVHYNRANALARLGRFDAAAESYRSTLELDPSDTEAQRALAELTRERIITQD